MRRSVGTVERPPSRCGSNAGSAARQQPSPELLKVGQDSPGAVGGQVNEPVLNSWENHSNHRCCARPPLGGALWRACSAPSAQPQTLPGSRGGRPAPAGGGAAELGQAPPRSSGSEVDYF